MKTLNSFAIAAACGAMALTLPATAADSFSVKVGGRVQLDAALVDSDENLAIDNFSGTEFRRVRLFAAGSGFDRLGYKLQVEFDDDGGVDLVDVYLTIKAGGGKLWLGQFETAFGMDERTSSKYTDFMERSMASQAIDLGRRRGIGYSWNNTSVYWAAGLFSQGNNIEQDNEQAGASARIIFNPVNSDTNIIHFGASVGKRETGRADRSGGTDGDNSFRGVRYRTNYHLMNDRIANRVGQDQLEGPLQYGVEFAGAWGPVTVKSEYLGLTADARVGNADFDYKGAYVSFLYTLGYNPAMAYSVSKGGVFDRIKANNVWQMGARYDMANSEFDGANEVDSTALTLGGTYILNPYTRFKAEVVFAESELNNQDIQDETILQLRTQVDF